MHIRTLCAAAAVALLAACSVGNAGQSGNDSAVAPAAPPTARTAAPIARDQAVRVMHERHEGMEQIGKATKAAGRALQSGTTDAAVIRQSAATIARLASASTRWFPAGTGPTVGKTGAKPAIWQQPADFAAKTKAFVGAAAAFDASAKAGDPARIQASFKTLGQSCKACHETYRSEMHH